MISHSATLEIPTPFFVHSWVIAPLQWKLSIFKFSGLDLHSLLAKNLNYSVPPAPQSMVQEIFFLTPLSLNPSVPLSFSPFYLLPESVLSPYSFFLSVTYMHITPTMLSPSNRGNPSFNPQISFMSIISDLTSQYSYVWRMRKAQGLSTSLPS